MPRGRRVGAGFSPEFLRAVAAEIARVERRLDRVDERIATVRGQGTKDRLTHERAELVAYERFLRERLLR